MIECSLISLPKPHLRTPGAQKSLGLLYIASALRSRGHSVALNDLSSYKKDKKAVESLPLASLYGITCTSMEIPHVNRFAKIIKEVFVGSRIVIGGPGAYSKEFIDFSVIDSVCVGDGEIVIDQILKDAKSNQMEKEYIGETVKDLDVLPLPARDLVKGGQGGKVFAGDQEGESAVIVSSRGCPKKCAFCAAPGMTHQSCLRLRDPLRISEEIKIVKGAFGINNFRFSDDFFIVNKKRALKLADAIGPLDINFRISCAVKPLDDEILKTLKQAGLCEGSLGIESFDNNVLKVLKKGTTADQNVKALELFAKHDITSRILFMIRTPGQTRDTMTINKHYLKRVPYSLIACTGLIPLPLSDLWENPAEYGMTILNKDLDLYNFYMFNSHGRRPLDKIFSIEGRDIDEFHKESEDFRDWLEAEGKVNKG